jgi:hypothetical protein
MMMLRAEKASLGVRVALATVRAGNKEEMAGAVNLGARCPIWKSTTNNSAAVLATIPS